MVKGNRRIQILIIYTTLFTLTYICVFGVFIQLNKTFVNNCDGRFQHYPTMLYVGRQLRRIMLNILKSRTSIPLFDISVGLGDNIIGFLNTNGYTDPLALLSMIVPLKYSEKIYAILIFIHLYLSGLSFLLLCHYYKKQTKYALLGSLIYCFSGYGIELSVSHPYFINSMILLPWTIIGIDKIIKYEAPYIFIFGIWYGVLCGYYFLYMITILLGIYALVRFWDIYKHNRMREFLWMSGRIACAYSLGIGLGAIVLLPAVSYFLSAGRSGFSVPFTDVRYLINYYYSGIMHLIAPPGGQDNMAFAAIFAVALVMLYISGGKRTLKVLLIIAFFIYLTTIGGTIMNGFQYPSNRWTFGLTLIGAYAIVEMLPKLMDLSAKQQIINLFVIALYVCMIFCVKKIRNLPYVQVGAIFLALTYIVLTAIPLKEFSVRDKYILKLCDVRLSCCYVLVIANIIVNGIYKFAVDEGNYINNFTNSGYEVELLTKAEEKDLRSYFAKDMSGRVDSTQFMLGTASIWQIPAMLEYNSGMQANVMKFWRELEITKWSAFDFCIPYTGQRTMVGTLLSQKYHVERENTVDYVPYGYTLLKKAKSGNLIFENNYALPWGYTYENAISYNSLNQLNGLQKQEAMLQAVAIDERCTSKKSELLFDEEKIPYNVDIWGGYLGEWAIEYYT